MQLYLAVTSDELSDALKWGITPVHLAYRLTGGRLLRDRNFSGTGGIMALRAGAGCDAGSVPAILRECRARGFRGILLEAEDGVSLFSLADALAREITVWYGRGGRRFGAVVPTDVCSGSFSSFVRERAGRAPYRALADVEISRRIYTPPCSDGRCRSVGRSEAEKLTASAGSWFSRELNTNYTLFFSGGKPHFMLFDNAASVSARISALRSAGIDAAVLLYSENTPETLRAALSAAQK